MSSDRKKQYMKEYWEKNKETLKIKNNERRKTYNKGKKDLKPERESRREYERTYRNSPEGKKKKTYQQWKLRGLNMDTFYYVYPIYLNATNCERCNVEFEGRGRNQKCMDHCHATGMFRNVVCRNCNMNVIKNFVF